MQHWTRTALAVVFFLLLAAGSVSAQVWVPGNADPTSPQASTPQPASQPADEGPIVLPPKDEDSRLSWEQRLELIRFVSGEFAKAKIALPGGEKSFRVRVGQPVDQAELLFALKAGGVAASPGDSVQITKLDFGSNDITVQINGGGNRRRNWLERIQISTGGPASTSSTVKDDYGAPKDVARTESILKLDFDRPLPEMTPDELKLYLSSVLDFADQRSAAVQWVDAQPPEIREAIIAKRAAVGMNAEQVLAALGRAERKVREWEPNGTEVEDWIYGQPPGKTIFVRFANDKVIRVRQYPLPADSTE
jgi:hypothetical protein